MIVGASQKRSKTYAALHEREILLARAHIRLLRIGTGGRPRSRCCPGLRGERRGIRTPSPWHGRCVFLQRVRAGRDVASPRLAGIIADCLRGPKPIDTRSGKASLKQSYA
jgi:hypothetical protein